MAAVTPVYMISLAQNAVKHKVFRGSTSAGRRGFSVHAETILWRWRTSAYVLQDCYRQLEQKRSNMF